MEQERRRDTHKKKTQQTQYLYTKKEEKLWEKKEKRSRIDKKRQHNANAYGSAAKRKEQKKFS